MALLAVALVAGCAGQDEVVDMAGGRRAEPVAPASEHPFASSSDSAHSTAQLVAFRDAAAETPFWKSVDWSPPVSVADVARGRDEVVLGTLVGADVPGEPRADELEPYEGAPTLYHLAVQLTALDDDGGRRTVPVPVVSSGAEGLSVGDEFARRLVELAPLGARVLLVAGAHGASIVAFEADDGSLVGYYSSLDGLVGVHSLDSLRDAIEAELAG